MASTALSTSASPPCIHGARSSGNRFHSHSCRSLFFGSHLNRGSMVTRSRARRELQFLVAAHLGQVPGPEEFDSALNLLGQAPDALSRVEGWLYTLADAAVATTDATTVENAATTTTSQRDWLAGITDGMEFVLKVLKDGLSTLKVPYAYGFAIILLTVLVKLATLPLTKSQVESTISMQNLQPKIKAIQERYAGNQERIQMETARLYKQAGVNPLAGCLPTLATIPVWIGLYRALSNVANEGLLTEGFFWIPSLAGPTTIASRQSGSGVSWLFPFVDGHPPLGWGETLAYLVLPVLLVASQYASMSLMQPAQTDPSQKNTQVILKLLPLMIGYFALSVPSGLSLYWLTNNVLSTGQQVWLRKLGGAKPVVDAGGGDIITAGRARRSSPAEASMAVPEKKENRRGEKFKQLKAAEMRKKAERGRLAAEASQSNDAMTSSREDEGNTSDEDGDVDAAAKEEEMYAANSSAASPSKSKRSKRRRP